MGATGAAGHPGAHTHDVGSRAPTGHTDGTGLTPQAYAEQVLSLIGAHGIRGTHASWEAVRREALVLVAGVSSTRETHGAIQAALAASGTRGQLIRPEDGIALPGRPVARVRPTTRGG